MASIFSRIIAGDLPGHFVWRDDLCVAIMTIEPVRPGHILVIPVEEIDQWDDLPPALVNHMMAVSQTLAKALKKAFSSNRVSLSIIGLEVPHTHIHMWPINDMGDIHFASAAMADQAALADAAQKIRAALEA